MIFGYYAVVHIRYFLIKANAKKNKRKSLIIIYIYIFSNLQH